MIHKKYKTNPTVEDLATELKVGSSYLITQFKNEFGETPRQMLTRLRMWHGEMLVLETKLQIQEIAAILHTDTAWFCASFREEFGESPLQYRKLYGKKAKKRS